MKISRLIVSLVALCLLSAAASAQVTTGSIAGTITDAQGGSVAGVTVTITNTDTNISRTVTTDEHGGFIAPLLPIGHYTLTAEKQGFKKFTQTGIVLNVNDKLTVKAALEVGTVTETVTVQATPAQVELQSATPAGLITGTQVRELALNTRNYEALVALMPGVSAGNLDQLYVGNSLPGGTANVVSFSVNGQRNAANNWTIDGVDNVDRGSDLTLGSYPSVDAISEFKVLRSLYDAEFGRAGGGQIDVVTKSGTNGFHGDAYEFFRSDVLAANNFLNNKVGTARPPLRYNNFGYTIGGPVVKDKTFFFFSEEWRRIIQYPTFTSVLPTPAMSAGNFTDPVCVSVNTSTGACNTAAGSTTNTITNINPAAAAYIKDIYSKMLAANSGTFNLIVPARNVFNFREEIVRFDHTFNSKFSAFGRYSHDSIPTVEPSGFGAGGFSLPGVAASNTNSPGWQAMGHYTYAITPTVLNDGGYAFNYSALISDSFGLNQASQSPDVVSAITLPFKSTLPRIPTLSISGFSGVNGFGPYRDYNRDHNVLDNLTWIKGRHTIRSGFSYHHYQKAENAAGNNVGDFSFSNTPAIPSANCSSGTSICRMEQAWANFLTGNVATFTQVGQDIVADIRQNQWEFYGQDEIRLRSNLTVTLGVRYSLFFQPHSGVGQLENFDPALYSASKAPTISSNGQLCLTGSPASTFCPGGGTPNPNYDPLNGWIIAGKNSPFGSKISNEDYRNVAPRIGIAWDPIGDGKTSIRAGYGTFYDSSLVGMYERAVFFGPAFTASVTIPNTSFTNPGGATPKVFVNAPAYSSNSLEAFTPLPWRTPYTQQWTLDVQRQIRKDMTLDVGYYANNAHHLLGIEDLNEALPGLGAADGLSCGNAFGTPCAGTSTATTTIFTSTTTPKLNLIRPFLGYAALSGVESRFNSNYHSLQAQFQKRWGQNSFFVFNYTWSHNLTNAQSDRSAAPQNIYNIGADYGPSALDRRHNVTADYVYEFPWYKNQEGFTGHVLGGWEISGLFYYYSGTPLTVTASGVDPGGLGFLGPSAVSGRPDITGNPNLNAGHIVPAFFVTSVFQPVPNGTTRPGNSGRGVVTGPRFQKWDLAVFKNTKIHGETMYLQWRAEAINAFNHTNFNGVGTTATTTSTFGTVTSAHDARIVQFGLKLYY